LVYSLNLAALQLYRFVTKLGKTQDDVRLPHCRIASSALAKSTVLVSPSITTNEARVIATHTC
jgi:hypothetical protein